MGHNEEFFVSEKHKRWYSWWWQYVCSFWL